jgi:hypothetical protein
MEVKPFDARFSILLRLSACLSVIEVRPSKSRPIRIPMDIRQIQPTQIQEDIHCPTLAELEQNAADLQPSAFLVPEVTFEFLGKYYR